MSDVENVGGVTRRRPGAKFAATARPNENACSLLGPDGIVDRRDTTYGAACFRSRRVVEKNLTVCAKDTILSALRSDDALRAEA
jgi:hypothetical protein